MSRKILILIFLMFSGFAFSQTTVSLEDQCNCEVLQGTDVSAPGANTPAGADLGDLYVNTTTGTIYFWDGNSWELTSTDTNTTNASLTEDGVNLILTDSDLNTVSIPLADIAAIIDTNTTNVTFTVNSTNGTLDIIDSDTNVVSVPLADIAALVDTDEQEGTEVPLTNPLDVDGDGNDETTVEEAIADLAANNGLDLDIDPANELTTSGSGVPAGAPVNDNPGVTYLDTATNELYVYDGTNWTMVTDNQNSGEIEVTPAGNITSTDVQAALEELDSDITTSELTTTVVEGSGTDVSTNVVGNNTEYTVSTEISATSGNNLSVTADGLFAADDQNAGEVAVTPVGNITSTDVQAALEELDSDITTSELTTTVVEGSGTDVSTNVVGNNTEYTVAVNVSELTGDGDITSGDLTVGGDANALLGDVTLEIAAGAVGNTELAADAVTSDKILDGTISSGDIAANAVNAATINADVAGAGLVQNASGALDVDVTALTGDGSITSTDLTVTGGANSTLNDVTLTIADNAITNAKMADDAITTAELATGAVESSDILDGTIATGDIANDAVTLGKLAAGSASGDLIQWNGTDWEYIAPSTLIPATTVSNTSNVNTLSTTVDGVTGTGVPIINSNALGLNGSNELISTVNGEASAALDLSPAINAIEKTTTVVEGSGTDVSTNVVGNNTEYTVAVNVSELTGDGDITSGDLTVGGDANALLGDVTLEIAAGAVGNTELAADAVTSDKILDGTISSDDIAADAVNNTKLADDAVQLENIADGTALGQVMQWDGSDWTLIDLGSVTVTENDGVIGNEVTNATDGTLVRSGSGTTISPYTLGVATGGIDTNELADDAVNAAKINADVAGAGLVQNASGALDVDVTALTGDGSITSTDLTVTGGANSTLNDVTLTIADNAITNAKMADDAITTAELATGAVESSDILDGTIATGDIANDAVTLGKLAAGSASGDLIQWNGTDWEYIAPSTLIPATTVSNTSNVNTLSTTVDGVTGTGVPIINSNALGLNGSNELISTVNGEASAALDLSPAINAIEKTTTVVEGTGIDVSSTTTGNNTEYTVTVDPTDIVGDGSITSPNSTITLGGTPANSILENVTLDVNESSLADGSITSPNSTITLGGTPANAIFEDVTLDVDVTALTGDGSITSTDLTVTGGANSTLNDVTLTIADNAITNAKMADDAITTAELATGAVESSDILDGTIATGDIANDAVTLGKLANGTALGQVMQWDGSDWTLVDLGSVTVTENDGVIGNEVTGATNGTLAISGAGTTVSPYTLAVAADGITNTELADDAVALENMAAGSNAGDLIQWNGTDWEFVAPSTLIPATTVSNASNVNTLSTTVDGVTGAGVPIVNSNALSINGSNELISTVNGVTSNNLSLGSYLDNTDEQNLSDFQVNGTDLEISIDNGNTVSVPLADIVSGVDSNTTITSYAIDATNTNLVITDSDSNTYSVAIADIAALVDTDTQYTAGTGLNLVGTEFSADPSLATDAEVAASELTSSVVAGTDISVSASTTGNNTAYTVTNTAPDQTVTITDGGNGNVAISGTYPNFIIDVPDNTDEQNLSDFQVNGTDLEISIDNGNTVSVPLADIVSGVDSNTTITSYAIDATNTNLVITDSDSNTYSVAIADIAALVDTDTQYTAGTGLDLTGTAFSVAADGITTTELANDAVQSGNILDDAVTLGKLANGTALGQVMQWDGSDWTLVDLGSVTVTENDGVIGNEVVGPSNGSLTLTGSGSTVDPLRLEVSTDGITTNELATGAVESSDILDGTIATGDIADDAVTLGKLAAGSASGDLIQWNGTDWEFVAPSTLIPATTVSNTSNVNTLSTTVDGVTGTGVPIINSNALSINGSNELISTVNGEASNVIDLSPFVNDDTNEIQDAGEVAFTATGNTTSTDVQSAIVELQTELDGVDGTDDQDLGIGTNGVANQSVEVTITDGAAALIDIRDGDSSITNEIQDASEVEFTPAGNITSMDVQSALEELDSDITTSELTTSVVEGTGIDVSSTTTGNNTEYTVTVDPTDIVGDGSITSTDLTVTGGANSTLNDVTLTIADNAITNAKMADDAITTAELATGAVESSDILDGTIATGDIANDAVTLGKLANGTALGQVMQWDGSDWTLVDLGSVTVTENDGVIGNEVVGPSNGSLTLTGSGSTVDPLRLEVSTDGITTNELATGAVESSDILDGTIATGDIADDAVTLGKLAAGSASGDLIQWNGTDWEYIAPSTLIPATTVSNTSNVNTLSTTVDGVTGTGVPIINSNALGLNGSNELISTVNGEASAALDLSPAINAIEKTTTVVEGTGIDVSSTTTGNNTEYTVTVDPTDIVGDGSITSPNSTITLGGTPANSILENVTLDVNESSLADGSITSPNSTITLGGTPANAIFEDVTLDVDVTALTGDGSITSTDLTVTGGANSTLNDVTLTIADNAITNAKMADDAITTAELATGAVESSDILDGTIATGDIANDAVTLGKLANGTALGQVMQWDGSDWTLVDLGSVTVTENDGVIGNEVVGPSNGSLTLTGSGSTVDPLRLEVSTDGITTNELATGAVESSDILDGTIATGDIANDAVTLGKLAAGSASGDLIQWNGTDWEFVAPSTLIPATTVSNTSNVNTLSTTVDGVTGTGVPIINSNALSINGSNELISTVNGEASNVIDLSPFVNDDTNEIQDAGEVAFDDSTASLGETDVQGAIEALASATDNDTQYTAGNGLNLNGSNVFTAVASPDANNALDVRANGIYATDTNTEYTAGNGLNLNGSNVFTAVVDPAANNALSVSGSGLLATDDQNAGEVTFDDSTASLGETDVQGAIEALASATDNDTQYTAGNGLNLNGSNVFTAVVDPAANNALSVSGSGLYATDTDDQNAGEVTFDDSTASLGETDVQGAIEALASATDNDTQYTAGNGLNLDGSNEFTAVASPDANNALDVRANGIYATDTNTEYTAGNGLNLNGSNVFTAVVDPAANNALSVSGSGLLATDDQNAGEVTFDDSTASLGETDVQGAIEALASATDNDTQYTAGNGLNLNGSNVFTAVVDPAANNALSVSGSGLYATDTDDQNAGEVTFDDSTASLGETDVQGAIEALASATDNDTQYTAGNGLNLDGSNEFTAVASPDANNALDVRANGIYATDTNTEYTAGNGLNLNGSNVFTAVVDPAANNALSVSGSGLLATDDQNAGEVTFDDSTASLGETDVQGAIEALASATDNDTQYTAGNGLNLNGSNVFTAVVDPAANNALSVSGSGLYATDTDDQNAGEVTFDDSTASLGETDVQGAIEALASATDNDTQYTAGNGLNLDGSNEFTAVVDPAANNALSVSASGLLATDDQNSDEVNNVASSIDLNGDLTVDAADIIDVDGDGVVDSTVQDVIEAITPITSKAARIFYPPSIAVDASSVVVGATIDLYKQYVDQYGMTLPSSAKSTSAPAKIPTYTRAELYYYVTYYDPTVFSNVTISDTGVMTYNVDAPPADYNSLINVVFVVK